MASSLRDAVIVESVRTPIGKKNGKLAGWRPDDLVAHTMADVVRRAGVKPAVVEDVIMGCVTQTGEQGLNIARNAALIAGFPEETTGTSVNRQCGSSQQAMHFAAMSIMSGQQDCVIAAGVESMTRIPMGADGFQGPGNPISPKLAERYNVVPQGISAEMIAEKWKLTRRDLDQFSHESHVKAAKAIQDGRYRQEIVPVPVEVEGGAPFSFEVDEGVRLEPSLEKMLSLKPSFKEDGVVTAGNSSQISDGAAALLLMSAEKAKALKLKPRVRILATAVAGVDPVIMLTGPIPATRKVLEKASLKLDEIDLIEINEAFACVVLAWHKELKTDMARVNVNGGAVAMGHPLGCSGARLMTTLIHEMERRKSRYGLQTMCIGFGQATATIVERVA